LRPIPPPFVRVLLAGALVWAAVALLREAGGTLAAWDDRATNAPPCEWHFGMAPVERLHHALAGVEGWLPRDTVLVFASPDGACGTEFFRWRWAAYLLPDLDVVLPRDAAGAAYEATYRREPQPLPGSRLEAVRDLDGGRLYRLVRP
jgi:hypothetical protein